MRNAFAHRLSVITGGPGTGKTASIRTIARTARGAGRAGDARRADRARGDPDDARPAASGPRPSTRRSAGCPAKGPTHDEDDPLDCDLLIVDESSMANLELLVVLLRAVGAQTHVVLVGDADQLAPVGAGKPFAELVAPRLVPTSRA